jgi:prevent-host-death family protein
MAKTNRNTGVVVSALHARTNFGDLLRRVEDQRRSLVIENRGTPRAVLLGLRDCVRLSSPEPEVLEAIGRESEAKGTDKLSSRQIDKIIRESRVERTKRK